MRIAKPIALGIVTLAMGIYGCTSAVKTETTQEKSVTTSATATIQTPVIYEKPENGAVLKVWESKGAESEFLKYAGKKFKEKYGVDVIVEEVNHTDARNKMIADGPEGKGADVFAMPHDQIGAALKSEILLENNVSDERIKNDFMPAARIASTNNNKIYGWPTAIETYGLFYNKEIFPERPATFEEIIEKGKGLTDKSKGKYGIAWEMANFYYMQAFIGGEGGYVFGKNGTSAEDIGLNSIGAVKGVENIIKLREISIDKTKDVSYAIMIEMFGKGKALTMINGPWATEAVKKSGVKYGIAPLPTFNGKNLRSFSGIRLMCVSAFTKFPKASKLFANFLISDEILLERFKMTKQLPPVKALLTAKEITSNDDVKPFLEQAQYSLPMPSIPEMQMVWAPFGEAMATIWNDNAEIKETLDKTVQTLKTQISKQKK